MGDKIEVKLHYPTFPNRLLINGGRLPTDKGAHACWYYCREAMQLLKEFDKGEVYETDKDLENPLKELALAIAKLYQLKDPSEFTRYMSACFWEAKDSALPWDERIRNPYRYARITY